jgi:hypothetical protein
MRDRKDIDRLIHSDRYLLTNFLSSSLTISILFITILSIDRLLVSYRDSIMLIR